MQIPWIKRSDLRTVRLTDGWVVKDPIALTYTQLDDVEYTTLSLLSGHTTLNNVLATLQRRFPHCQLSHEDLTDFFAVLAGHQLIRRLDTGDSGRLQHSPSWGLRLLGHLSSVFRVRLRLFDPSPFVDWLLRSLKFVSLPLSGFLGAVLLSLSLIHI